MPPLLEAKRVTKVFGGGFLHRGKTTIALDDFSMTIESDPPAITAIVGESGSGKTTLARLLLGIVQPTRGEVRYNGKDLRQLSGAERRAFLHEVQVIFQDPYEVYNPFYKVDHVLETPIAKFGLATSRAKARALMEETLHAVGLRVEETLGRYPHQLSGGQRQRVMVARALLLRPRVIIADEPVSMVDASLRATILDSLRELNRQFGISLLYITHDLTTAYQISENIIVLYRGAVAEVGDVARVVQEPEHPYTQLLVGSVPLPDPNLTWQKEQRPAAGAPPVGDARSGCRFVDRCPVRMPICWEKTPPLYRTERHRASACFHYQGAESIDGTRMNDVFVIPTSATGDSQPHPAPATG